MTAVHREPGLDRSDLPPRERPGRAPWMVFGSLVVLVFIGFGTFNLISLLAHEEHDEHATFDAAGIALVHVDNSMGPVRIERADTDVIDIAVHVSDGLQHTGVSWHVEQSTLEVRGTCPIMESPWCRSAFTLLVPPDIAVDVDSDYGRVEVSDRDGAVDIHSGDARVELANLTGPVVVDTDNGRVVATGLASPTVEVDTNNGRIELGFVAAPDRVTATSDNGRIDITVPRGSGPYDVAASTDNGSRTIDVPTDPDAAQTITAQTDNGDIQIEAV